jgi:hypothetical protein
MKLKVAAFLAAAALSASAFPASSSAVVNAGFLAGGSWASVNWLNLPTAGGVCTIRMWSRHGNVGGPVAYSDTRSVRVASAAGACTGVTASTSVVAQVVNGSFQVGPLSTAAYNAPIQAGVPSTVGAFSQINGSAFYSDHSVAKGAVSDVYRYNAV